MKKKETKEFQLGQALKTNKEILKKIKIEKNDNFSNNGEKKAIEDFKENINKIVKDVENTLKKVEEKKKNDEIKKMKKTDFKIKQEIENSEKKEQSPAETERKYLGVNIYPDILENPKRFLKENEGIMKKTKKYDDSNSKLNNSTQNHNPITTEINENVQIKETSKKEEYFEKNNDVNRNRMQSLNSDWSLGDNNYHSSFREYPNDTEKKQTVLIEDPEINRTEKKKLIGKNEEADFGSEIRLKTSEKCEKSNIVSKINNLKKEIDFRIGKLKENQKSRVYNRINYSNEEIDEYCTLLLVFKLSNLINYR